MRRLAALAVLLVAAGCDSDVLGGGTSFGFATDGTDVSAGVVQLADGSLVVVGSAEGRPRPADGTLAHPVVLRFGLDGGLAATSVYRDLGYGAVYAVAPLGDGLAVAVTSQPDDGGPFTFRLFRTDADGRGRRTLFEIDGAAFPRALAATPDGDLLLVLDPARGDDDTVVRLTPEGDVVWSARPDVGTLRAAGIGPDGAVYLTGVGADGMTLARVDPETGATRWRVTESLDETDRWVPQGLAALPDGVARIDGRSTFEDGSAVRVVRYTGAGRSLGATEVVSRPGSPDGEAHPAVRVSPGPLAALPDGRVAAGWVESGDFGGPAPEAFVTVVGAEAGAARRFGRAGRWPWLASIAPLADGRLAAAGAIGPAQVSGYGGDDFDVLVTLYEID